MMKAATVSELGVWAAVAALALLLSSFSLILADVSSQSSQRCAVDGLVLQSLQTVVSLTLKYLKQILHFTSLHFNIL